MDARFPQQVLKLRCFKFFLQECSLIQQIIQTCLIFRNKKHENTIIMIISESKKPLRSKPPSRQMFQIVVQECTLIKINKHVFFLWTKWRIHKNQNIWKYVRKTIRLETTLPPLCREGGFEPKGFFSGYVFPNVFRYFPVFSSICFCLNNNKMQW